MDINITEADSKIIDVILNYIDEDIYRYAILINGEWGCGKTYFAREKLYHKLKEHEEQKEREKQEKHEKQEGFEEQESNSFPKDKPQRIQYISLYGIKSLEEITSQIMLDSYFEGKKKIGKKFLDYGKELTTNILPLVFNIVNPIAGLELEHENVTKLFRLFHSTKKKIMIFDDLERCNLPIGQILGYINSLVEHCGMKVIIIANEKEIKNSNSNDVNNADHIYLNIKEKLIGVTLQYCPDSKDALSVLINSMACSNKNVDNENFKLLLEEHLEEFQKLMDDYKHHNLRTFQFFLAKIYKIYTTFSEKDETAISEGTFIDRIILSCFEACILIKMNAYVFTWGSAQQLCYVSSIDSRSNKKNWVFRFIEDFLKNGILDEEIALTTYEQYEVLEYISDDTLQFLQNNWTISDENTVSDSINVLLEKTENGVYSPDNFSDIIILFLKLKRIGFTDILDKIASAIENYARNREEHVIIGENYSQELEDDIKKQYEEVVTKIQAKIDQNIEPPCDLNTYLQKGKGWAKDLHDYTLMHIAEISRKDGFLIWFDIHDLIKQIEQSNSKDIYYFRSCIIMLYVNHAIGEALLSEFAKIDALKNGIKEMDKSNLDKIVKLQIAWLIENLENAIDQYPTEAIND